MACGKRIWKKILTCTPTTCKPALVPNDSWQHVPSSTGTSTSHQIIPPHSWLQIYSTLWRHHIRFCMDAIPQICHIRHLTHLTATSQHQPQPSYLVPHAHILQAQTIILWNPPPAVPALKISKDTPSTPPKTSDCPKYMYMQCGSLILCRWNLVIHFKMNFTLLNKWVLHQRSQVTNESCIEEVQQQTSLMANKSCGEQVSWQTSLAANESCGKQVSSGMSLMANDSCIEWLLHQMTLTLKCPASEESCGKWVQW